MSRRSLLRRGWIGYVLAAGLSVPAGAQTPADSLPPNTPSQLQALDAGTIMKASYESLVIVRPAAEIEADLQTAREAEKNAAEEHERVRASSSTSKDKIAVMKSDKDATAKQIDLAKKNKLEAEKITLESKRKSQELQIKVLERDAALKQTHAEVAKKEVEEAQVRQRMYQLELELAWRRGELDRLLAESSKSGILMTESFVRLHRDVRELERRVLETKKDRSDKAISAAKAEKSYVEKQLDLVKAQAEALAIK